MEPSSEYDYCLNGACLPAANQCPQEKAFLESLRVFPVGQLAFGEGKTCFNKSNLFFLLVLLIKGPCFKGKMMGKITAFAHSQTTKRVLYLGFFYTQSVVSSPHFILPSPCFIPSPRFLLTANFHR